MNGSTLDCRQCIRHFKLCIKIVDKIFKTVVAQENVIPLNEEVTFFCGNPIAVSGPLSSWP